MLAIKVLNYNVKSLLCTPLCYNSMFRFCSRLLGYTYEDNELEKQDKFLKRMSGIMHLYAALLITTPPPGSPQNHPLGLQVGWAWLSNVMNLTPRPDITATLLNDFLQVAGNAFVKTYGKQFIKLIQILKLDFLPKVHAVTPQGSGGPVQRLETFFSDILRTGNIPPAKGTLTPNFWLT